MNTKQACDVLGVKSGASAKEVDAAFRKKAAKLHPDVNKEEDAEQSFKNINEAYQFLKKNGTTPEPYESVGMDFEMHFGTNTNRDILEAMKREIFKNVFSVSTNFPSQSRVEQVKGSVSISFSESVLGCTKDVKYKRKLLCVACSGVGQVAEQTDKTCEKCSGNCFREMGGKSLPCTACKGSGKALNRKLCVACEGKTVCETDYVARVHIPPGIQNGTIITMPDKGDKSIGKNNLGGYTDAYIRVVVAPDDELKLIGDNVVSAVSLTLLEALTGVTKAVKTVTGERALKIPGPRKHGDQITADGLGTPPNGKHIFILSVQYPDNIQELVQFLKGPVQDGYIQDIPTAKE